MEFPPKTLQEAKQIFNRAICVCDFEVAEEVYNQIADLKLIDEERNLGLVIDKYLTSKQVLSNHVDSNCINYNQVIQNKTEEIQKKFMKQFKSIKIRQETELGVVFGKWRQKKLEIESTSMTDYEESISIARLLASQTRFKEAKEIRDSAFNKKNEFVQSQLNVLNSRYESLIKAMLERHESELSSLIRKRDNKLEQLNLEMNGATFNANENFNVGIADKVVDTFKSTHIPMPLAMAMQTKCCQPYDTKTKTYRKPDRSFNHKMKSFNDVFAATDVMNFERKRTPNQRNKTTKRLQNLATERLSTP